MDQCPGTAERISHGPKSKKLQWMVLKLSTSRILSGGPISAVVQYGAGAPSVVLMLHFVLPSEARTWVLFDSLRIGVGSSGPVGPSYAKRLSVVMWKRLGRARRSTVVSACSEDPEDPFIS